MAKNTIPEPAKESPSKGGDLKTLCAGNPTGRDKRKCQLYSVLSKLASKGKKDDKGTDSSMALQEQCSQDSELHAARPGS